MVTFGGGTTGFFSTIALYMTVSLAGGAGLEKLNANNNSLYAFNLTIEETKSLKKEAKTIQSTYNLRTLLIVEDLNFIISLFASGDDVNSEINLLLN